MKKLLFQGQYYEVPLWATYIAKDVNGHVYAYETQPFWNDKANEWDVQCGQLLYLGNYNSLKIVH